MESLDATDGVDRFGAADRARKLKRPAVDERDDARCERERGVSIMQIADADVSHFLHAALPFLEQLRPRGCDDLEHPRNRVRETTATDRVFRLKRVVLVW